MFNLILVFLWVPLNIIPQPIKVLGKKWRKPKSKHPVKYLHADIL